MIDIDDSLRIDIDDCLQSTKYNTTFDSTTLMLPGLLCTIAVESYGNVLINVEFH